MVVYKEIPRAWKLLAVLGALRAYVLFKRTCSVRDFSIFESFSCSRVDAKNNLETITRGRGFS